MQVFETHLRQFGARRHCDLALGGICISTQSIFQESGLLNLFGNDQDAVLFDHLDDDASLVVYLKAIVCNKSG